MLDLNYLQEDFENIIFYSENSILIIFAIIFLGDYD